MCDENPAEKEQPEERDKSVAGENEDLDIVDLQEWIRTLRERALQQLLKERKERESQNSGTESSRDREA